MEEFKQNLKKFIPRLLISALLFLAIPLIIYIGTPTQSTDIFLSDGAIFSNYIINDLPAD